jgi:hypothetical protein
MLPLFFLSILMEIKMEEIWKDIKDYEGLYQVSNLGKIKSFKKKEHILKQWKRSSYFLVDLWKNGKRDIRSVHHLVYETFHNRQIGGFFIHHKDENKDNNRLDNLELMTYQKHNQYHHGGKPAWNKGLKTPKEVHAKAWKKRHENLCPRNTEIINLAKLGKRVADIAKQFGICSRQIYDIIKEK